MLFVNCYLHNNNEKYVNINVFVAETDIMSEKGDYLSYLSQVLWNFQQNGTLCDVVLTVNGQEVKAHKVILAASSEYFKQTLNSMTPDKCLLCLDNTPVLSQVLLGLLQYLYTGILSLTEENVHMILQGAEHLKIVNAEKLCRTFLQNIMPKQIVTGLNNDSQLDESFNTIDTHQSDSNSSFKYNNSDVSQKALKRRKVKPVKYASKCNSRKNKSLKSEHKKDENITDTEEKENAVNRHVICAKCKLILPVEEIEQHIIRCEYQDPKPKEENVECPKCSKQFMASQIKTHIGKCRRNVENVLLACEKCEEIFSSKRALATHTRNQHQTIKAEKPVPKYQCEFCNEIFRLKRTYSAHVRHEHKQHNRSSLKPDKKLQCGSKRRGPYSCDHDACDKVFKDRRVLKHHQYKDHGLKDEACPIYKCTVSTIDYKIFDCQVHDLWCWNISWFMVLEYFLVYSTRIFHGIRICQFIIAEYVCFVILPYVKSQPTCT